MHTVQLVVLLTFIAEYPNVRFFFGIPAWVLGAVYVAAEVLQLAGDRAGRRLLFFVVSLLVGALAARASACSRPIRGSPSSASRIAAAAQAAAADPPSSPARGPAPTPCLARPERARRPARQDQRDRA